jgi:hypothetical protein
VSCDASAHKINPFSELTLALYHTMSCRFSRKSRLIGRIKRVGHFLRLQDSWEL